MNYITILSLLQKNFRLIHNRSHLKQALTNKNNSIESLTVYLAQHETTFVENVLSDRCLVQREADEIAKLQEQGITFCSAMDPLYPASFLASPAAPMLFSFEGTPCWLHKKSIAVVGSRDTSNLSRLWMEDVFATFLQRERPVVVSGGARGIDQMAHQLALRNDCATIMVLPSGLGTLYPKTLDSWRDRVVKSGGCLLSEYSYEQPMLKHFFHDRNRLIAALGAMTLLVEAKRRSGSLLTAHKTLELGKSVLVVPGHPSDSSHLGNIDLLCDGATPVRDAEDLCMYFRSELRTTAEPGPIASQISFFEN